MWQVFYNELKEQNFEIIGVALDAAGPAAVQTAIARATNPDERAEVVRNLMGWGNAEWRGFAPPEYLMLIDEQHVIADLYGITNVPMAVWIDEDGRIARPTEAAGFGDDFREMNRETFEQPADNVARQEHRRRIYVDALRDWVKNGRESEYALSGEEARRRMRLPADSDVRAAAHVRLGRHFYRDGDLEAAKKHFEEAVRLCPDKWNYRRQSMVLDPELVGQLNVAPAFWNALDALGEEHYYPPIEMRGIASPAS